MRYLIDTQALIWFVENNPKLSISAREVIETSNNEIFVCQFSFVEIAIKEALHKVVVKNGLKALMVEVEKQDIKTLPITQEHILSYGQIPLNENHKDPFDRMIMATAFAEKLPIITSDEKLSWYAGLIEVVW